MRARVGGGEGAAWAHRPAGLSHTSRRGRGWERLRPHRCVLRLDAAVRHEDGDLVPAQLPAVVREEAAQASCAGAFLVGSDLQPTSVVRVAGVARLRRIDGLDRAAQPLDARRLVSCVWLDDSDRDVVVDRRAVPQERRLSCALLRRYASAHDDVVVIDGCVVIGAGVRSCLVVGAVNALEELLQIRDVDDLRVGHLGAFLVPLFSGVVAPQSQARGQDRDSGDGDRRVTQALAQGGVVRGAGPLSFWGATG